jgi:excisionase family DNA binding protein
MKVGELAALLRVTDKHVYKLVARGQLPSFRLGSAIRIDPRAVADLLRRKFLQLGILNEDRLACGAFPLSLETSTLKKRTALQLRH